MPRRAAILDDVDELAPEREAPAARPLSKRDADKMKGPLADLIMDAGEYANRALSKGNRRKAQCDIWSFDEEEAESIAEIWLRRGQKSARMAVVIRYVLDNWQVVNVAIMLIARTWETALFAAENGIALPGMPNLSRFSPRRRPRAERAPEPAPARGSAPERAPAPARVTTPAQDPEAEAAEARQRAAAAAVTALRDPHGTAAQDLAGALPPEALERAAVADPLADLGNLEGAPL